MTRSLPLVRRMRWIFTGIFALVMLFQLTTLALIQYLESIEQRERRTLSLAANQILLAEEYERTSYLAMIGLATSNWELLLDQRREATLLSEKFTQATRALREGRPALFEGKKREIDMIEDPAIAADLAQVSKLWKQVVAAQVRVLRSNNYELNENPNLESFRTTLATLIQRIEGLVAALREHHGSKLHTLERFQSAVPVAGLALTLLLGMLVFRRLLLPLGATMEELATSREALRVAHDQLEQRVRERTRELAETNQRLKSQSEVLESVLERLQEAHDQLEQRVDERTRELRDAQRQLVASALAAGKAEVATNILHNVGNVLNGVNVLTHLIRERLQLRQWQALERVADLIDEHRGDLGRFFTENPRGRKLPDYITQLAARQQRERSGILERVERLTEHIDHIKRIVELQQEHAKPVGLIEDVGVEHVIEDALDIHMNALERHGIEVTRDFAPVPVIRSHKHKLLQILVNLISNAKYALADPPRSERRITIRLRQPAEDRIGIEVEDSGVGLAPEMLSQIFRHGFTTRREGHGFGLHASAIAADEMGGSLVVHSDGPGQGACFTLELPLSPEQKKPPG